MNRVHFSWHILYFRPRMLTQDLFQCDSVHMLSHVKCVIQMNREGFIWCYLYHFGRLNWWLAAHDFDIYAIKPNKGLCIHIHTERKCHNLIENLSLAAPEVDKMWCSQWQRFNQNADLSSSMWPVINWKCIYGTWCCMWHCFYIIEWIWFQSPHGQFLYMVRFCICSISI